MRSCSNAGFCLLLNIILNAGAYAALILQQKVLVPLNDYLVLRSHKCANTLALPHT